MTEPAELSTFEKYVLEMSLMTNEQLDACRAAQKSLQGAGLSLSLEELALRLGQLPPHLAETIFDDIKREWKIAIPRPAIAPVTPEEDKQIHDEMIQKGGESASRILECKQLQIRARKIGVPLCLKEILRAKGYLTPEGQPAAPAPVPVRPPTVRRTAPTTRKPAAEAPARNWKLIYGAAGAAVAVLAIVAVVLVSGDSKPPPAPPVVQEAKLRPDQAQLWSEGADRVLLYSEDNLLEIHAGKAVPPAYAADVKTPVTLHGYLKTDRNVWLLVRTPKGVEGWAVATSVKADFDLKEKAGEDRSGAFAAKLAVKQGRAPVPVVAQAPKPSETEPLIDRAPKPPEPKPAEPKPAEPKPAEPEPEPAPVPVPDPAPQEKPVLVGHWTFDEGNGTTARDAAGKNEGTITNARWVPGWNGTALSFNGVNAQVSMGVAGLPSADAPQTVSAWYSVPAVPAGVQTIINLAEFQIGWRDAKLSVWKSGGKVVAAFVPPVVPGWHHVAYTFDGRTHRLYADGLMKNSSTLPPGSGAPSRFELGGWEGKECFQGQLDEVRIYAKALPEMEVRELAQSRGVAAAPKPNAEAAKVPAPGNPPPPPPAPPPPGASEREKREKRAQELWDLALKLENEGKIAEAQAKLKELRSRYKSTSVYFGRMIELSDKINDFGKILAMAALDKTVLYRRAHVDSFLGYEFLPPDGWKGIPPFQGWVGDQDSSEVNYKGQTVRVTRYTSPHFAKLYLQAYKSYAATDLADLEDKVTRYHSERYGSLTEVKDDAPPSKAPQKMPFVRKLYESDQGDRFACYYYYQDRKAFALVGVWRAGSEDGGFFRITVVSGGARSKSQTKEVKASPEEFAHALKVFDQCARTFWIYDGPTRSAKQALLKRGSLCSDWSMMESSKGNYLIEYATRPDYAKRCGEELEQILALYRQVIPSQKGIPQVRVKVFDREDDFLYYGQMPGAAAYWSPAQEEIVCYRFEGDKVELDDKKSYTIAEDKNPEEVTFKILYHEGFHQYMYFYMGRDRRVDVPSWINEGLGDYFFGGQWSKARRFTIGVNDWRVKTIHKAVKANKHVPLKDIIKYQQSQYYSKASLCYAQGWSMQYFFLTSDVAKKKGYSTLPVRMMEALKTGGDWERATEKVFAGVDLKKMEEEWKEFVLALPVPPDKPEDDPLDDF